MPFYGDFFAIFCSSAVIIIIQMEPLPKGGSGLSSIQANDDVLGVGGGVNGSNFYADTL